MLQKPPTKHVWSEGFPVYEGLRGVECRGCGARSISMEYPVTDEEVIQAGLPLDCEEAVAVVIHEDYKFWEGEDLWEEEDQHKPPVFKEDLQSLEPDKAQSEDALRAKLLRGDLAKYRAIKRQSSQ
jgi:hypothetical protein